MVKVQQNSASYFFPQRSLKPNDVIRMLSLFSISQQDSQGVLDGLFTFQFICEERRQSDTLMVEKKTKQPKERFLLDLK